MGDQRKVAISLAFTEPHATQESFLALGSHSLHTWAS